VLEDAVIHGNFLCYDQRARVVVEFGPPGARQVELLDTYSDAASSVPSTAWTVTPL